MQSASRNKETEVQKIDGDINVADTRTKNVKTRCAGKAHGGNEIQQGRHSAKERQMERAAMTELALHLR